MICPGNPSVRVLTSMYLTSLDQLLLILKTCFTFEELNCTEPSPSVCIPSFVYQAIISRVEHLLYWQILYEAERARQGNAPIETAHE